MNDLMKLDLYDLLNIKPNASESEVNQFLTLLLTRFLDDVLQ